MIYFIQAADGTGPVKIGTTVRLSTRLAQLRDKYNCDFRVLAVVDGGQAEERKLHDRFSAFRTTGEWFEPVPALLDFIKAEGKPWDGTNEIDLYALASFKGTDEMKGWLDGLVSHAGQRTRTTALWNGLRLLARSVGYEEPMPDQ